MEARAFRAAVASLSSAALRRLCSNKSGKHWQTLMGAFQDCDVDGAMISDCVDSVDSLHVLLRDQLGLELPKMIAVALHQILAKHTANQAQQDSKTRPHAKESDQVKAAPAAYSATPAEPGTPTTTAIHLRSGSRRYARVSLCVNVQEWGQPPVKIMLDICAQAKVATVQRVLLERMQKSLTTHAHLAHAGVPIYPSSAPPNWASLSFIHAVISNDPSNLTLANAAHHPLVVEGGCVDCSDLSLELPTKQLLPPILRIFDSAAIIGNGAFGLVYQGSLDDVHSQRPVAVKKFFMLENPSLYGLCDKTKVHAWINRELLPEINILARLTHPNVVRLRCVGLQDVFGVAVPGCIAMDLCDGGTLEKWIRFENVTDVCTVHFIRDLVAGMHYLHHQAQIVHRDLKPDNLFIKLSFRPTLVIGDVGCSKQADRALSLVSAAGAVAYRAPEALGGLASFASDVFSASLVAIELVTGKGVFEESNGDETKKQALVDEAQQTMECILSFADDSDLNIEAVDLLLRACTIADPTNRPTFQLIEAKCARGPADYLPMLPSTTTKASRQGGSAKHRDMQTKAETPDHKGMPEPEAEADAQARATAISNMSSWAHGHIDWELARDVNLSHRRLTGSIPAYMWQLSQLQNLYLPFNQLTGFIPTEIGHLVQLTGLSLRGNRFSGCIPTEIGNLHKLTGLWLNNNQLTGRIPTEVGRLVELKWLELPNNQLIGLIPSEIGQLTQLSGLWLKSNRLSGRVPSEIGRLTQLTQLRLASNPLTDTGPFRVFLKQCVPGALVDF